MTVGLSDIKNSQLELITKGLINACLENAPKSFIPYLLKNEVQTNMSNKIRFYSFFKTMINCAFKNSGGPLLLKIEQPNWSKNTDTVYFNFYDTIHKNSRISLEVRETDDSIYLKVSPF